jgi:hypothetical protein
MLMDEWNMEEYGEVQREEGMEKGLEKGQNMILELVRQGLTAEQIEAKLAEEKNHQITPGM